MNFDDRFDRMHQRVERMQNGIMVFAAGLILIKLALLGGAAYLVYRVAVHFGILG